MSTRARQVYLGVDSGTQSTKVVLIDGDRGDVLASGAAPHQMVAGLPPGHLEQRPEDWFAALETALRDALATDVVAAREICGIGVSGQQHGFVALDDAGEVIRPAKLWCDTSTAAECDQILAAIGGLERCIELTGNGLPPGYTASKILWLKNHEPANFARLATVLLPHDFLNFRLTGTRRMECGDASGTGLFDVRRRTWSEAMIAAIDGDLASKLPALMAPDEPCGTLSAALAERWAMADDVVISPGGGDNMMAAIGSGAICEGVVTTSLGTSGTILTQARKPVVDPRGEIAAFCDSTGAWLPLACTMNVTVATELVKQLFGLDNAALESAAEAMPIGADGLLLLPYFEGERTPNVPDGTGIWFGANRNNNTPGHYARAAMEGAVLGLAFGLRRMAGLGVQPREIRLTGGGAKSELWRRICADAFGVDVVCLEQSESAALGAALQAKWVYARRQGADVSIAALVEKWIRVRPETRETPNPEHTARYREMSKLLDALSQNARDVFSQHRRWVSASNR